jgi:hypothetical protein
MGAIKPLVLEWCIESWRELKERRELIIDGWMKCCTSLFNVMERAKRIEALAAVAKRELDAALVPDAVEEEQDQEDSEEEEEEDELDLTQERVFGERRSAREHRPAAAAHGYQISSSAIAMSEDSES